MIPFGETDYRKSLKERIDKLEEKVEQLSQGFYELAKCAKDSRDALNEARQVLAQLVVIHNTSQVTPDFSTMFGGKKKKEEKEDAGDS